MLTAAMSSGESGTNSSIAWGMVFPARMPSAALRTIAAAWS
jgi:hypothetical protein